MAAKRPNGKKKSVTIRDVVVHMQGMEQRLSKKIDANTVRIDENTAAIRELDTRFTERIDALEEDLIVTIKDTVKIRQHVGMPVPLEE